MSELFYDDDIEATEELLNDALEHWRDLAIQAHPGASPMREWLTAKSKDGVIALAKDLESKLGAGQPAPSGPSVPAGSPALGNFHPGDTSEVDEAREAYKRNPSNANYSTYLRAKYAEAGIAYPGDE